MSKHLSDPPFGQWRFHPKGQPLFRIEPDEKLVHEDPAERKRRIRANTDAYLENVL